MKHLYICLLRLFITRRACLFIFTLLPLFSIAQQAVKPSLPTSIPSREQLFLDIKLWQDSLASLQAPVQDTARLKAALDSLKQQALEPKELARKADSLAQAYTLPPQAPEALKETEAQLRGQIAQAKDELTRGLVPEEANKLLQRLEQVSSAAANPQLPQAQGLPKPGELQGVAKARTLKSAGDHFAGHEAELRKARAELDKYKGRFEKVESVQDMPKGFLKLNPLKGRPWPERVVLGTQWQLGKQERFNIDLGPYAAWRFTDKFSVGAGAQYRLSISVEDKPYVSSSDKMLGYFAFTDMEVYKGFFVRAHYEDLNAPVPRQNGATQSEEVWQEWVKGLSVGVGKTYTFYKRIKGYGLVQYNVLHQRGQTPYLQPLQTKVGFYIYGSDLKRRAN